MMPRMPLRTGPLIGRDTDLSRLADAIGLRPTPGARPGGVVVLSGDAGIGKSRIVAQLVADATDAGWFTAVGHCVGQAGSSLAYLPFVELVGAIDAGRPDVVERVLETHPSLGHLLPGRVDAPDGQGAERAGRATDPGQVAEAVHALLTALGDAQPSLVVVEDVHWADHSSRDLITLLLTRGFTTAVGLVVTYRSDDLHRRHPLHETLAVWERIAGLEHVELAPLPDDAVRELVSGIEGAPTDAGTATEIARRAEGNPFFAEELVASAAAGQALTGGLSRVLRARVEQLDDTTQRVLRAIALKGGQFIGHDLLSRVVDLPDETLEAALAAAVEHHVLEARWPPAYTFRHALLGEAVADSLLPGERLRLHRAYAAMLAERPELAPASELARHAAAVGDLPTAVRASRAAAESAMAVGGPQEALLHFERALSWLDEDDPERDEVTLGASRAATVAGEPIRAIDLLRDRLDHPGTAQQPGARADLLATLVIRSRILDLPVDSVALTDEALSLIGEEADERRVRVLVARVQALVDNGSFVEAAVVGRRGVAARRAPRPGRRAHRGPHDHGAGRRGAGGPRLGRGPPAVGRRRHPARRPAAAAGPAPARARSRTAAATCPESLALYDRGAEVARRMHREWAPWGQECRLLGGLTAYELGDWDGVVRRLDLAGRPAPQPGRAIFTAAALSVQAGRGEPVDPALLDALRQWWHVDAICVVLTIMPAVDVLGQSGDLRALLDLTEAAVRVLDSTWGEYHAIVRLAALVAGQSAALVPSADPALRARALAVVDELADRGRLISELRPAVEKSEPTQVRAFCCRVARGHEPRDLGVDGPARGRAPAPPAGRGRRARPGRRTHRP